MLTQLRYIIKNLNYFPLLISVLSFLRSTAICVGASNIELAPITAPVSGIIMDVPLSAISFEADDIMALLNALLLVIIASVIPILTVCFLILLVIFFRILQYIRLWLPVINKTPDALLFFECFRKCYCKSLKQPIDPEFPDPGKDPGEVIIDTGKTLLEDLNAQLATARQKLDEARLNLDLEAESYWSGKVIELTARIAALS